MFGFGYNGSSAALEENMRVIEMALFSAIALGVAASFISPPSASRSNSSGVASISGKTCKVESGGEFKGLKASYHQLHQKVVQFLE